MSSPHPIQVASTAPRASRPQRALGPKTDYERIEACIQYLEHHRRAQPELSSMARHVGMSEFHLQRMFSRWAGISPKGFLKSLTLEHAKRALERSRSVLDAALDAGLSGPGRLHDLFVTVEGVTPGEFKSGGKGLTIWYGVHATPFGACFLGVTSRGVCALSFLDGGRGRAQALRDLTRRWPGARIVEDVLRTRAAARRAFSSQAARQSMLATSTRARREHASPLRILLSGTPFQIKVWQALLQIPAGAMASYQDLARLAGSPHSARAVGNALSENPVAYLIPCHRVIHASGAVDGYRWGTARKRSMLVWEAAGSEDDLASGHVSMGPAGASHHSTYPGPGKTASPAFHEGPSHPKSRGRRGA